VSDRADERLWREVRAGRRAACAGLVEAHYESVYRFLLHLSRDVAQAEDLTQETFAAAWEKAGDFRGDSTLRTWLHRIAYGKFVDARRARQRRAALAERLAGGPAAGAPGPLEAVMADDQARHLSAQVQRLDPPERALIVLHYFQGLSYRDMAAVLGQPSGTVQWRTGLALRRLRALMGGEADCHDGPPSAARRAAP
jgi:RNA polymerase sigma-70 factor (ECF subfamily)